MKVPNPEDREAEIRRLADEGWAALDAGDHEIAIDRGRRIQELHHSAGFEIEALAHAAAGDTEQAIVVLEEGVRAAPRSWLLWQLLGNMRSELERWDDAHEAYEGALGCDGVDRDSVEMNMAVALGRAGRHEAALARLPSGQRAAPDLALAIATIRVELLVDLGRFDEAVAAAKRALLDLASGDAGHAALPRHRRGRLHLALARAQLAAGDRSQATTAIWHAVDEEPSDPEILALARELTGERSASARGFRLLLRGACPPDWVFESTDGDEPPAGAMGFLVNIVAVADDEAEAMRLAARFVAPELRGSLAIEDSEDEDVDEIVDVGAGDVDAAAGPRKGIYFRSGFMFFPLDEPPPN